MTQMFPYQSYPPLNFEYNQNAMFEQSFIKYNNQNQDDSGYYESYHGYDNSYKRVTDIHPIGKEATDRNIVTVLRMNIDMISINS